MSAQGNQSGGSDFERALAESAELLRDMTREVEKATRGLAGLGGATGSGFKSSGDGGGSGKGVVGGAARIGAGVLGGVAAVGGREALLSFARAGDPVQGFIASTVQAFDFTGLHKPSQQAGAATLGILGQAAASGANVTGDDVSREFSFQKARAQRTRAVQNLVDEQVNADVVDTFKGAPGVAEMLDVAKSIRDGIYELRDLLGSPFGGGSR